MKRLGMFLAVLLFAVAVCPKVAKAAPELELLPLSAPSTEMMAMAAAVTSGPTFFYVGSTQDTSGFQSVFSNEITVTFGQGQHNTNLTWTAASVAVGGLPIAGYNFWRSTTAGGPYTKITTTLVPATAVAYTDTFVLPNALSGLAATVN